jgi:hypothetical protein
VPISGKMHATARKIVQLMASRTGGHILMVPLQQRSTNMQDPTNDPRPHLAELYF